MDHGHVTLYIATSVDGYIADEDGGVDWLDEFQSEEGEETGEFTEFLENVDCLVMGQRHMNRFSGSVSGPTARNRRTCSHIENSPRDHVG